MVGCVRGRRSSARSRLDHRRPGWRGAPFGAEGGHGDLSRSGQRGRGPPRRDRRWGDIGSPPRRVDRTRQSRRCHRTGRASRRPGSCPVRRLLARPGHRLGPRVPRGRVVECPSTGTARGRHVVARRFGRVARGSSSRRRSTRDPRRHSAGSPVGRGIGSLVAACLPGGFARSSHRPGRGRSRTARSTSRSRDPPVPPARRVVPAPAGGSLDRVRQILDIGGGEVHAELVTLDPPAAASKILGQLRDWGYLDAPASERPGTD